MPLKRTTPRDGGNLIATPRDPDTLVALLTSSDSADRQAAARGLAGHSGAAETLVLALGGEGDRATREAIAMALVRTGGGQVVGALLPMLRSEDAGLRNTVIGILKELPADVAPHMESLLDDPDPDVRIFVVNVLEALRHPKVEDWLIAVIRVDPHVNVVATALDLLGEVGTEAALGALASVDKRFPDEPFVAFAIATAFKRIKGA
jgi:HEAT repeat protein